jgi:hypothetical protein
LTILIRSRLASAGTARTSSKGKNFAITPGLL